MRGLSYPADDSAAQISWDKLRYMKVLYVNYSGVTCEGELVCNKAIADDLIDIFRQLYAANYQICQIRLVDDFMANDDLSIAADNTSCFNYRVVEGTTRLSNHGLGRAIDINPLYNPCVYVKSGRVSPPAGAAYADRSADFPHKIDKNDLAYKLFIAHGFTWGGDWKTLKDYQHFEKK
ncbi:MAG: M15 family metallopeptidase [Lachnospiraceae bacterium]|nr:M15 family metallopeptidase [Lachnospiraceae bacterium]